MVVFGKQILSNISNIKNNQAVLSSTLIKVSLRWCSVKFPQTTFREQE